MNIIHITFGEAAYGNLKNIFHKRNENTNEKIICINEDFSIGPIHKLETAVGMQERRKWLKELLTKTGPVSDIDYLDWIETVLKSNSHITTEVSNESKVILWYGNNPSDEIGLRFVVFLLQNKNVRFETVNVTEYARHIGYKVHDINNKEIPYTIRSLGGMPPKFILDAFQTKKNLSNTNVQNLIKDWEKLSQTKNVLRILSDGDIITVAEDHYDCFILENTSNEYKSVARVIGEIIEQSDQYIGELYLIFRVHVLIQQGKLNYKGNLEYLGQLKIKRT
ncbi:DUF1835 domain-containing protein [Bacillus cereus]|uniref:DUF1835 domain-containing protein n=1 Tax=Bacillus cereus TaxID=1396 RepID=UPI000BF63935|nr:DUF1835 domain-containing protein [Bacillus cereus]PEX88141.1 hypothetical protein CN450_14785 [Bacillus cereus]